MMKAPWSFRFCRQVHIHKGHFLFGEEQIDDFADVRLEDSRKIVGPAARAEWHHQSDRTRRIGLSESRRDQAHDRGNRCAKRNAEPAEERREPASVGRAGPSFAAYAVAAERASGRGRAATRLPRSCSPSCSTPMRSGCTPHPA